MKGYLFECSAKHIKCLVKVKLFPRRQNNVLLSFCFTPYYFVESIESKENKIKVSLEPN